MPNQIFVNPHPYGVNVPAGRWQYIYGSLQLAGTYPTGGEPLAWNQMITGLPYAYTNFAGQMPVAGNGPYANGSALITALAASAGTITATANNRFIVGQKVNFKGLTTTLGLLLNGTQAVIVTASATQFTFVSTATGTGTGETGMAVSGTVGNYVYPLALSGPTLSFAVTNIAVSGGIVTVTTSAPVLPGASVSFRGLTTALGLLLNASVNPFTVLTSTGTTFTFATTLTGAAGAETGFVTATNPPQPFGYIEFQSQNGSGYQYSYNPVLGTLSVQLTPGTPITGAYPSAVLNDIIVWNGTWAKDR